MHGAISPLPQYAFMVWCLVKHRDNFTFTFTVLCSDSYHFEKQQDTRCAHYNHSPQTDTCIVLM